MFVGMIDYFPAFASSLSLITRTIISPSQSKATWNGCVDRLVVIVQSLASSATILGALENFRLEAIEKIDGLADVGLLSDRVLGDFSFNR